MIVNHFNNWQFNESNTENVDVEEYIGLKQNNEEVTEESFQSFNLKRIYTYVPLLRTLTP